MKMATNNKSNIIPYKYNNSYCPTVKNSFQYETITSAVGNVYLDFLDKDVYITIDGINYHFNTIRGLSNGNMELWLDTSYAGTITGQSLWFRTSGGSQTNSSQLIVY